MNAEELCSRLGIQDLTNRYALYVGTKQLHRLIDLFWAGAIFDESAQPRDRKAITVTARRNKGLSDRGG